MPAYLTETLYRLCTRDLYSFFLQNKPAYHWITSHWIESDDETIGLVTFRALVLHYEKRKRTPGSLDALIQYVRHNPDGISEFERTEAIEQDLLALANYEADTSLDDNLLFDSLLATARRHWFINQCKTAAGVALGNKTPDKLKDSGPSAAITWLRGEFAKDYSPEAPVLAGVFHENIPDTVQGLADRLTQESTNGRFPIGFSHIDNAVVVGKQNLRFLAILGMSGDGKTTLTNQIVYNWVTQGAHVLYVSTEHNPLEIWEFMAFLHQSHSDYAAFAPSSLSEWENRTVTEEEQAHMYKILCDIQDRRNLPGLLDCQQFYDWDSIVDYLTVNHHKNRYDILVVDYLGRLDADGDPRWHDQAMKALVHKAQKLTREFDNNKGIILLSPIQVNREGNKKANKAEEGEARYDLNAISQISEYQHDLDLCLSVWSDEDMKTGDQIEIQQLKQRKGKRASVARMNLDPATGAFTYLGAQHPEVKANGEQAPDAAGFSSEEIGI